ncbi:MAG: hypothetical protein LBM08_15650 [Dysgonamonadaceae bacterium]|jgi:hypothetical protein|nr:hypothetical protein [Dysgonamonadaceae bacterium]
MRRKVFGVLGVVAFGAAVAFHVTLGSNNDSDMDLTLINAQVLALSESVGNSSSHTLSCPGFLGWCTATCSTHNVKMGKTGSGDATITCK